MKIIKKGDVYFREEDSAAAEKVQNEGARYVSKSKWKRVLKNHLKKAIKN